MHARPSSSRAAELWASLVVAYLLLAAEMAQGERLRIVLEGVRGVGPGARIVAVAEGSAARVAGTVEQDGASLDLPAGTWTVRLEAHGYWAPAKTLPATERDGPEVHFALPAWRTGQLRVPRSPEGPTELQAAFKRSPQESGSGIAGSLACAARDAYFDCELPAARLDVELRAPGFVPVYSWDLQVPTGGVLATPAVWLGGASLAGFVQLDDGKPCTNCTVRSRERDPDTPGAGGAPVADEVQTNARGFFQIVGLPPGVYLLRAASGRMASAPQDHRLAAVGESRLARPLVVGPPQPLELRLAPGRDPYGKPWYLTVAAVLDPFTALVREQPLAGGRWSHAGLPLDTYTLSIADSRGGRWRKLQVALRGPTTREVTLGAVPVTGTLTLGGQPLAGRLVFSLGDERLTFETDARGQYQGFLPDQQWRMRNARVEWSVFVRAPRVARTLTLPIDAPAPGTSARVDVGLPETLLRGRVLDETGRPISAGVRLVLEGERPWRQRGGRPALVVPLEPGDAAGAPGEFAIQGLEPGRHFVAAETERGASEPIEVTVQASGETRAPPLRLHEVVRVRLRVVDRDGPVRSARVVATPIGAGLGVPTRHATLEDGTLQLDLPPDTLALGLLVAGRNSSFRLLRSDVHHEQSLTVRMPEAAGGLRLRAPGLGELPATQGARGYLLAAGFAAEVETLRQLGLARATGAAETELLLSGAGPGSYELCWQTPAVVARALLGAAHPTGCVKGSTPAAGELALALPIGGSP